MQLPDITRLRAFGLSKLLILLFVVLFALACSPDEQSETEEEPANDTPSASESASEPDTESDSESEAREEAESGEPESEAPPEESAPEETLELQYQYINTAAYREAYELFTEDSRQSVSLEEYQAYFEETAPYEVVDYSFPSVQVDGDTATVETAVTVSTGPAGIEQYQRAQELELSDGGWQVVMRDEQVESFTSAGQDLEEAEPEPDPEPGSTPEPEDAPEQEGPDQDEELAEYGTVVTVSNVVDGDTIDISPAIDGVDRVRLIGMDTPETHGGEEPLGAEATAFAESELAGQQIDLEFDEERIDPYDRLLAYAWTEDGTMFNEEILAEGLAQVATFPPNTRYLEDFEAAQSQAQSAGVGIWGLPLGEQCQLEDRGNGIGDGSPGCESVSAPAEDPAPAPEAEPEPQTDPGAGGGVVPPESQSECPPDAPTKGNVSSSDELIYHSPGGQFYDQTNPEECFASGAEAEAAGYRASQR